MIKPIRGPLHWPKCNVPTTMLPPLHQPQIGRPRKQRRKSRAEVTMSKDGKLTRKLRTVTCDKCGTRGHNSRTCTGPRQAKSKAAGNKRKERSAASDVPDNSARRSTATDKGKGVAVDDGKKKKGPPRKKVVVLG